MVAAVKRTAETVFNEFRDPVRFSAILIRHNGKTESSPFIKTRTNFNSNIYPWSENLKLTRTSSIMTAKNL